MNNYTVYHLHSDRSLLDSCTNYKEYINKAVEYGMKAICFSEHGNIFSWINKKMYCDKVGIKYIHGCEVYLTATHEEKVRDNYHTILIAKNMDGFRELNTLIDNATTPEHTHYKPRISFEEFFNISNNIIKISACLASPLNKVKDEEVLDKFEILYNYYDGSMIIPHRSPSGEFVGCIKRSFNEKEIEDGKKYMPLTWGNITYKYPKAWNIYGYYQNKENIKRYEKCIVYEAEKATLHYGSIYKQENNIALSLGGMNMSKYQAKLLIDLHCKEITIALDCQYRQDLIDSEEDTEEVRKAKEEFNLYIKKIMLFNNTIAF